MKTTIRDLDLKDKRVFLRADLNVPISDSAVLNDLKIISVFPTINLIYSKRPKSIIIGSHLGRPKGRYSEAFSLRPVYNVLKKYFKDELGLDLVFSELGNIKEASHPWILLENLRFNDAEESGDDLQKVDEYRNFFMENADVAVIDAFGCLHRECGSIQRTGLPSYAGLLIEKELSLVKNLLETEVDLIILGGKKISDKICLLSSLMKRTKNLFIVGGLAFSFLKYMLGKEIGDSVIGENSKEEVERVCDIKKGLRTKIILPTDFVILHRDQVLVSESIPQGGLGLDIGPQTIRMLDEKIASAKTIFWNGPPGMFEKNEFSNGTRMLVQFLGRSKSQNKKCFCGGGETASAVGTFGSYDDFTYVSTGGGALMQLLGGNSLPGLEFLESQEQ